MATKKLCTLIKDGMLKDDKKRFQQLVRDPRFFCKKCGRVATLEKYLCKAAKL